jgi:aminodeoxyfutalosine deaminase
VIDSPDRRNFVRSVPKAEIHLHLEGSVGLETLLSIARARGESTQDAARARLAGLYAHRDFPDFLQNFRRLCAEIRRPEDFARIAADLSRGLQDQNVRYAEVFCSPIIFHRALGLPATEIMDAVSGAARVRERDGGPRLRFLLDGVRQFGPGAMGEVVADALACRHYDVIGVGMGGDEMAAPTRDFAEPYREARRAGLRTTVHAGESDGPRSVWEAMEVLEVERIGHGVRAAEDAELVKILRDTGLPLECCPTSNIETGTVPDWERHPIRCLHEAGLAVTVNSDDPAMFGTSLVEEWDRLMSRLGLTPAQVLEIGARTARASFLPAEESRSLAEEMWRTASRFGVTA